MDIVTTSGIAAGQATDLTKTTDFRRGFGAVADMTNATRKTCPASNPTAWSGPSQPRAAPWPEGRGAVLAKRSMATNGQNPLVPPAGFACCGLLFPPGSAASGSAPLTGRRLPEKESLLDVSSWIKL
jgi:hypothetical protein